MTRKFLNAFILILQIFFKLFFNKIFTYNNLITFEPAWALNENHDEPMKIEKKCELVKLSLFSLLKL